MISSMARLWVLILALCARSDSAAFLRSKREQNSTQTTLNDRPKLIFMFLVYDRINNEQIWNRFFDGAAHTSDYRVLVHCKHADACRKNIQSPQRYEIIPSVPTAPCTDLVNAMNALLKAGVERLGLPRNVEDKLIFISDSTLPVKPFSIVQSRLLSAGKRSNFCIFPTNHWPSTYTISVVKHHQWMILTRSHAVEVLKKSHEEPVFPLEVANGFSFHDGKPASLCRDEFWYFALLFGTITRFPNVHSFPMAGLNGGGDLSISDVAVQGQCDTFVSWGDGFANGKVSPSNGKNNNLTALTTLLSKDGGVDQIPPSMQHPATFRRFSFNSIVNLRSSWFLFARKVEDGARFSGCESLADAFSDFVFSVPTKVVHAMPTWPGSGKWRTASNSTVSIVGTNGTIAISGVGFFQGSGFYCKRRMEVVFQSYSRKWQSAHLSADGKQLSWDSGHRETWHRI